MRKTKIRTNFISRNERKWAFIQICKSQFRLAEYCSPWRAQFSSPMGFCHVTKNQIKPPFFAFASPELRLAKFLAMAISVAKLPGALWKSSPFSSPLARHGELAFAQIWCFCSCLMFGHSIPAQMGRVRWLKRNRSKFTFLSAFPWITCETSNKRAINEH